MSKSTSHVLQRPARSARPIASLTFALAVALTNAHVGVVRGDEPTASQLASARELFSQGVKLEEARDWPAALERFRAVAAVKKTSAVHFHLGLCLLNTGKLVEALDNFQRASDAAALDPSPDGALITARSKKHVSELDARIPRLSLRADPPLPGLRITIDGAEIALSLTSKPIPLDPGKHLISASAEGHLPYETRIELVERAPMREMVLSLAVDPDAVKQRSVAPRDRALVTGETRGRGPFPYLFGAVSLAALSTASVMYGLRASAIHDLEGSCSGDHTDCPPSKRSVYDRGKTYTTVGNVLLGVGAVTLTTSVLLFVLIPTTPATHDAATSSSSTGRALSPHALDTMSLSLATFGDAPLGASLVGSF